MFVPTISPLTQAAINSLDDHAKQLAERFPDHRITFGYIGNLERWGDDRSWRIFTRYMTPDSLSSVSYYLGGTDGLRYDRDLARKIDAWAESLAGLLSARRIIQQF